jgi:hypothetical protein
MKRSWNWHIWIGFVVAVLAAVSYIPVFALFPITRDFPWVNLLLFLVAGILLVIGMYRAYAQPDRYRGKVSGAAFSVLSLFLFGLFCFGVFYEARRIPSGETALRAGQPAPDFQLAGIDSKPVTLSHVRQDRKAVLLIFYRGYW